MPCRDYESDNGFEMREHYKAQCDKLARIACAAMEELVKQGKADFLVLKNEEVRTWWEAHVEADRKEKARIAEKERRERVKREALDRLTDEEKELLGLAPKVKKTQRKTKIEEDKEEAYEMYAEDVVEYEKELQDLKKYCLEDLKVTYKHWR